MKFPLLLRVFAALALLVCAGCKRSEEQSPGNLQRWQEEISSLLGSSDAALGELRKLKPDDALNELSKLKQFEYKVYTLALGEAPDTIEARLMQDGREGWECAATARTEPKPAELLVVCKRRPHTLLKYVPQSILGR